MKFVVPSTDHRPWPATVTLQSCDPATGEIVETTNRFVVFFGDWTAEQFETWRLEAEALYLMPKDGEGAMLPVIKARNAHVLPRLIEDWGSEVQDEQGNPLAYSRDRLAALLRSHDGLPVAEGLWLATHQVNAGLPELKNALTSPAPGPNESGSASEATAATSSPTT